MSTAARARTRPVRSAADGTQLRWPGAAGRFALFAEVLWTGVLVSVASLAVLTAPAALVAGMRHLRRYLRAEESSVRLFTADVRASAAGGAGIAAASLLIGGALGADILIASSGGLPLAWLFVVVGWAGLAALAVALVLAAAAWTATRGWRGAVRGLPAALAADPVGALLIVVAVGLTAVACWQLPPLAVPALGCLVFAAVATGERAR